jgi:hypothetical protein
MCGIQVCNIGIIQLFGNCHILQTLKSSQFISILPFHPVLYNLCSCSIVFGNLRTSERDCRLSLPHREVQPFRASVLGTYSEKRQYCSERSPPLWGGIDSPASPRFPLLCRRQVEALLTPAVRLSKSVPQQLHGAGCTVVTWNQSQQEIHTINMRI